MAEQQFVLVHKESGQEFTFSSRSDYVNTKAQGGYRDKRADETAESPRQQPPAPQPERQSSPRRFLARERRDEEPPVPPPGTPEQPAVPVEKQQD